MGQGFGDLEVYQLSEELSDEIWEIVVNWDFLLGSVELMRAR